jgi:hypothetical protein
LLFAYINITWLNSFASFLAKSLLHHKLSILWSDNENWGKIVGKLLFHMGLYFLHSSIIRLKHMMHIWVGWNIFDHLKIFHPIYTCIIHVLNPQHPCAKNTNPWNNIFHVNFKRTNEIGKFVMYVPRGFVI